MTANLQIRRGDERGRTRLPWLDSRHAFSFGGYLDFRWPGFRGLRVLNEDVVASGTGFGPHPHRDAEILSFVLEGALLHGDSTGARSVVRAGEVQHMTAGRGVVHAEWNASADEPVRFVQVWLRPDQTGLEPGFERAAPGWWEKGGLVRLASGTCSAAAEADLVVRVHADADVYAARLDAGDGFAHPLRSGRGAWLQVPGGRVEAVSHPLAAGDALAVTHAGELSVHASEDAELLLFDLA